MVFYADLRDIFLDLFLMTLVDENEPELSLIHFLGPKTFRVVFYCLTKVVTDILLPRRLKILVHTFPGGKKLVLVVYRSCFLCLVVLSW